MKTLQLTTGLKQVIFSGNPDICNKIIANLEYNDLNKYKIENNGNGKKIIMDYKYYYKNNITVRDIVKYYETNK